jgi:hypothetical protein
VGGSDSLWLLAVITGGAGGGNPGTTAEDMKTKEPFSSGGICELRESGEAVADSGKIFLRMFLC